MGNSKEHTSNSPLMSLVEYVARFAEVFEKMGINDHDSQILINYCLNLGSIKRPKFKSELSNDIALAIDQAHEQKLAQLN